MQFAGLLTRAVEDGAITEDEAMPLAALVNSDVEKQASLDARQRLRSIAYASTYPSVG